MDDQMSLFDEDSDICSKLSVIDGGSKTNSYRLKCYHTERSNILQTKNRQ